MDTERLRLIIFLFVFFALASAEYFKPFRQQERSRFQRWPSNLALTAFNSLLVKVLFPISAVGFAAYVEARGWGLFNQLDLPYILKIIASVIILDLIIYLQHVAFHYIPIFWRLHRMHHTDVDFDVTTGARFHPIEILVSMLIKLKAIALLGAAGEAILMFEIILNSAAMFNHSNITLPKKLDTLLRYFLVTPDMHRIHHSVVEAETNSNFGFNLSWWDKLFGTYLESPKDNPQTMPIGLDDFRAANESRLDQMLIQPFKN
jgi:sterol desaturase/sphingolipid hydroxylase (fatty acid hydroxylase superfamily)